MKVKICPKCSMKLSANKSIDSYSCIKYGHLFNIMYHGNNTIKIKFSTENQKYTYIEYYPESQTLRIIKNNAINEYELDIDYSNLNTMMNGIESLLLYS